MSSHRCSDHPGRGPAERGQPTGVRPLTADAKATCAIWARSARLPRCPFTLRGPGKAVPCWDCLAMLMPGWRIRGMECVEFGVEFGALTALEPRQGG